MQDSGVIANNFTAFLLGVFFGVSCGAVAGFLLAAGPVVVTLWGG